MRKASLAAILAVFVIGFTIILTKSPQSVDKRSAYNKLVPFDENHALKTDEPGMFIELHNYLRTEDGQQHPAYEAGFELKELAAARKANSSRLTAARTENITWDERGPGNVSGRTPGIWIDPNDTELQTWVLGSSGGGIWRTTDGGNTWNSTTDEHPNLTTSDLQGSSANKKVVYAGTGKKFDTEIQGNGMLKSTNRGRSWSVLESTLNNSRFVNITRVAVNQADENELIVSTSSDGNVGGLGVASYLMKSTDGGESWSEVMVSGDLIQQVVASPQDFNIQFASINGTAIMRSTDAGENWETVFTPDSIHLDSQTPGRMEIALSPSNPNRVFIALSVNDDGNSDAELYVSDDQGLTWSRVIGRGQTNNFGNWFGEQGWYDNTIAVHPYIDSCVYVGGAGPILKITLFGQENDSLYSGILDVITDGYGQYIIEGTRDVGSKGVHVDHHNLVLIPTDEADQSFHLFNGNDGGIAISTDGGESFLQTGIGQFGNTNPLKGYNTVEFYGVDKKNGEDRYLAGSQDNGSWLSGANPGSDSEWDFVLGGDGFFGAWHYTNPDLLIGSVYNNILGRSTDQGDRWFQVPLPVEGGPFITEVENSKIDPDLVFLASPSGLIRSKDFGITWEVRAMPETWAYNRLVTRIAISLDNPDVVWSGASIGNGNRIAKSLDGGETWTETAGYEEANRGSVTNITTHPTEANTAFIMFSQANGPKILKTTDGGQSWSDISGFVTNALESANGFPDVPTYCLVVMPHDHNTIWAGTSIGIVESLDGGETWALKSDHNLPAVAVWDMRIVNDEVIVATHGRGIWSVTIPELAEYEPIVAPLLSAPTVTYNPVIAGSAALRSDYDSTLIIATNPEIEDQTILKLNRTQAGEEVDWSVDLREVLNNTTGDQNIEIIHRSWKRGVLRQQTVNTRVVRINEPVTSFSNDVSGNFSNEFIIDGFRVSSSLSIQGNAFHTPHPYEGGNSFYSFALRTPFRLSADTAVLRYKDIAIVEPGNDFGAEYFDYVAIEAVKLPIETPDPLWIRLTRYDSRQHADWLAAYNANENATPSADLFKEQVVDLYESGDFVQGDEVLIRFSLVSDPFAEGYGWVVDDISFNTSPAIVLSSDKELLPEVSIYPNPVVETASVKYVLESPGTVNIQTFNIGGALIDHVSYDRQNTGTHTYQFDASSLNPGMYMSVISTDRGKQTLKWVLKN